MPVSTSLNIARDSEFFAADRSYTDKFSSI
jgi:hypothetical protein